MEEGKFNTIVLSFEEVDTSFLFFHIILCHSSTNHVRSRGRVACVGHLLCAGFHVLLEYSAIPKIISLHCTIPPLREHHVSDQVQRNGVWVVQTWELLRMGCH